MEQLLKIYNSVKSDFCELTTYKIRNNSIEIITPFSTLNELLNKNQKRTKA